MKLTLLVGVYAFLILVALVSQSNFIDILAAVTILGIGIDFSLRQTRKLNN
jgi:hypothetical protein